jgi:signal peptidase I
MVGIPVFFSGVAEADNQFDSLRLERFGGLRLDSLHMIHYTTNMRRFFASLLEILEVAIVAVGAVFLIRTFLIQPFLVSGASMIPTFADGDYLLIDQVTYRFREPERGEVVVFRSPADRSTYFIKRIIGLPLETVVVENGVITIANEAEQRRFQLKEDYIHGSAGTRGEGKFVLGEDEYFLLGDNRSYSFDSRSWGALSKENLVGLVRLRLWPVTELTAFAAPHY